MNDVMNAVLRGIYRRMRPQALKNALALSLVDIETGHVPEVRSLPPGKRVLVLAPHADDETLGCGGSLRKLRASGVAVKVLFISDGRLGDREVRELPENHPQKWARTQALIEKRHAEATAAMAHLGVSEFVFLDLPDGELSKHALRLQIVLQDNILNWKADALYLPFISDRHLDHQAVAAAAIDAISQMQSTVRSSISLCAYEIWSPLYPNLIIDITSEIEAKGNALQEYVSQLTGTDYQNAIRGLNQYRTMNGLYGKGYAEAFYCGSYELFLKLLQELRR